jgi:hypothetical protein
MLYHSRPFTGDHKFSPSSFSIHRNTSKYNCSDILEEEDAVELNDIVEDVIVDEVVTSVDDDNNDILDIEEDNMNILRDGRRMEKIPAYGNESNIKENKKDCAASDRSLGTASSAHQ